MFVRKDYRGKELGIAQLLLDNLVAYCRENDINAIYLGTVDLKAAHRFYEKNGFTRIAKEICRHHSRLWVPIIFFMSYI
jgi:GNAT superfamily N-acetyltransferase